MGRTKGSLNKKTIEAMKQKETENKTVENEATKVVAEKVVTTSVQVNEIPLPDNIASPGFCPEDYKEYYDDGTPFLPAKVQIAWFRRIYPQGYIQVDTPQLAPRSADDTYWTKATVYAGPGATNPLADASVQRGPKSYDAMELNEKKIDFFSAVQTVAISEALRRAGFWCKYTKEEHAISYPKEKEENTENPTTETTVDTTEVAVPTDGVAEEKAIEVPSVESEASIPVEEKSSDVTASDVTAEETVEENTVVDAIETQEVSNTEPVETEAIEETVEVGETVEAESVDTAETTDITTEEENVAEATEAVEETVEATENVENTETVAEETAEEAETADEEQPKTLTAEEEAELAELRALPFKHSCYDGTIGELETSYNEGNELAVSFVQWLLESNIAKRKQERAVAAITRLAELLYPNWLKK